MNPLKLSLVAQQGINELRNEKGIEPTLDEIIWLHELGKAQEAAGRIDGILEGPAQAGKYFLWPMTILSAQWYRNNVSRWFASSPLFDLYGLAFALSHGRGSPIPDTAKRGWFERLLRRMLDIQETRTLEDLQDRNEAVDAISMWIKQSGATRDEIEGAVDYLLASDEDESDTDDEGNGSNVPAAPPGINYDDIVHELSILGGNDPDYWRTRTSKDATIRAYMNALSIEQARKGSEAPSLSDPLKDAIKNFRKAIVAIIKAHTDPVEEDSE